MASINWGSIHKKIDSASKSSEKAKAKSLEYSKELGAFYARAAAKSFINTLKREINSNPLIDVAGYSALENISCTEPYISDHLMNGYIYTVDINFDNDMHRQSLAPEYFKDGIDNIAALINNGYYAGHIISGVWEGHMSDAGANGESRKTIPSRQERAGARFAQNAVRSFKESNTAKFYHVIDVGMNDIYN